ncbi:hypothetical protein V6N13_043070 [Hibiscus sabdariffa]
MLDLAINITLDQNPRVAANYKGNKEIFSLIRGDQRFLKVREFVKFAAYQGTQCKFFTTLPPDFGFRTWIAGWDFNFIIPLRLVFAYHVPTQRSIYGLKQASQSWNLRFNDAIKEFGFIRNEDEPCVYKKFSGSIVSFLILYVDDILIIGNDIPTLQSVKAWLSSCFSMKDLGETVYILGVKIYRDRSRRLLGLSQSTYIDKVLKRFNMEASKKGFLPMTHGIYLSKKMCPSTSQERERMSQIPYASAIGSIMYAMICTRPDLAYALSMTSRYQANPASIKGYTDASFQTDKDDSRSQSGFVFRLNVGVVSWKSSKQDIVADSTTEAEYIAASKAEEEAVWIKKFVTELGVVPSISDALELYCDNNGAIVQAKEPKSHQRSKHILRRFYLIREIVDREDVEICKVHTDDNIVDPLTKPLSQQKHDRHTESLGIRYVSDWS